jgi:hypothetical protein
MRKREGARSTDLLAEGRRLVDEAEVVARVPGDRTADVLYLRATAALHDYLATQPRGEDAARAYAALAVAYRRLEGPGVWSLASLYEEACVRGAPGTDLARTCFARLKDQVYADELGNAGGALPSDVARHLDALARVAGEAPRPRD